ncbi:hypothetical protein niasHT_013138 [Heterodera trifolii]|uniref:Uncharacterized protein n=1 Tax=Heterodera trifolii TaxID=157864 RepID=A0ABD2IC25_9BILA
MKFTPLALLVILLVSLVAAVYANSNNPSDAADNGGMRVKRQQQWRWSSQQQRWVSTNIANVNIAQNG